MKYFTFILFGFFCLTSWLSCARSPYTVSREARFTDTSWLGLASSMVMDSALTSDGDSLFFGSSRGTVYRLNASSGDKVWEHSQSAAITSQVLSHDGKVFFGTSSGNCVALEAASGKLIWTHEVTGEVFGKPVVLDSQKILFGANNGYFYALDMASGERVWQYKGMLPNQLTIRSVSVPILEEDRVYVGFNDGTVAALHVRDGRELWKKRLAGKSRFPDVVAPLLMANGRVVAAQFQGKMNVLMKNGSELWSMDQGGSAAGALMLDDLLIFPGEVGQIFAVDPRSGAKKWELEAKYSSTWSGLSVNQSHLLATSYEGYLHLIDTKTGQDLWRYNLGAPILGPAVMAGGRIWLLTRKGTLFGLEPR